MPQMYPTLWLVLMISMIMILIIMNSFIHFSSNCLAINKNSSEKMKMIKNWKW